MAYWRHGNQVGGFISLAHRQRTPIRWDGIFEAPDDAALEAELKASGHKRLKEAPGPDTVGPPRHMTQQETRVENRRLARMAKLANAPAAPAAPLKVPTTEAEALTMLKGLAKKHGVASGGTLNEVAARLTAAGVLDAAGNIVKE